jgi:ring-1,2-phenylacetyl-CoA epoxidase subunit PaaE
VKEGLMSLGVEQSRVHSEHFASDVKQVRLKPDPQEVGLKPDLQKAQTQVTVVLDGRRRTFEMASDGTTVLEAAEAAGLELPYSCRAGVCSTCRTRVVSGAVTMMTNYALEPWEVEAGYVLCCQALPAAPELEITYDER